MAFDLSMSHTLARLPVYGKYAYGVQGFNPAYMATLQERMVELMTATGWTVGEIARIANVTSAAVSQWVGNGSGKQSKSIGNVDAALRLEKASGFSWLWLAQGKGAKLVTGQVVNADEIQGSFSLSDALEVLTKALQKADKDTRIAIEPLLASIAKDPEESGKKSRLILTLLVTEGTPSALGQDSSPGHIHGQLGKLDLGAMDGRRDRAAASGGSKK